MTFDRRSFVRLAAAGLVLGPGAARAQTAGKPRRIGFLSASVETMEYEEPLRQLGWIEGKTVVVERRLKPEDDGKVELLPAAAAELVRLKCELIITDGTDAALAAKQSTQSIPIVMAAIGDPVAMGIVTSLAHPGGNITGYSMVSTDLAPKRAALVHELLPSARRVALIVGTGSGIAPLLRAKAETAYRALGITPIPVEFDASSTDEGVLARAVDLHVQAVEIAFDGPMEEVGPLMDIALRHRLPVIAGGTTMLKAGALMSFSNNVGDQGRRVAAQIDKILRGARAGDLPIEQPTRFEFGINLKTAQFLGIAVPQSLLVRADEVVR